MAAYISGHAACVIINGQTKREQNEENERTVRIPFDSEYSIRIKNTTNFRSLVKVQIDGTICAERLLLRPHQTLDLERFVIDGDLLKGKRFKFVRASDPNVQDPTAGENGLIEVIVEPEVQYTYAYNPATAWSLYATAKGIQGGGGTGGALNGQPIGSAGVVFDSNPIGQNFMNISSNCSNAAPTSGSMSFTNSVPTAISKDLGATVEGSQSNQRFTETNEWFQTQAAFTIPIRLRGLRQVEQHWVLDARSRRMTPTNPIGGFESFEVTPDHVIVRYRAEHVKIQG